MRTPSFSSDSVLSEADVQAFVDGSLAPERAAQVRRYLRTRPDEARRVAFYDRLNRQMQTSFADGDIALAWPAGAMSPSGQRSLSLSITVWSGWLRRHVRAIVACACVLTAVAAAALWAQRVSAPVLDAAALMVLERTLPGDVPAAPVQPLRDAPDLSDLGWQAVMRTSVPVGPGMRAAGFIYRNRAGERAVLLSVRDWTAAAQPQWQARRVGDLRLLGWTAARTRYVLGGRAQMSGLMRAADELVPR